MQIHQFQPIISFIWSVADDLLRDVYVKGKIPRCYPAYDDFKEARCYPRAYKR